MSFVHLHVHSEYSLLDGFSNIHKLVSRAKEMDMPALAITDHGTMYGAIEFYQAAKESGIKPIIGIETYLAARTMKERDPKEDKRSSHLLLLAENETGYSNLLKLASTAQLEGFYYFPRIDKELLAKNSKGLIFSSGCMSAEVPRLLERGQIELAQKSLDWYFEVFGNDNFFLELQQHDIPALAAINKHLLELGSRYNARFIATNDVHYINPEDARLQDILLAIQTGTVINDPDRMRMTDPSYYLRSPEEMANLFAEVPEALGNTLMIAERCKVNLEVEEYRLPQFDVPDGHTPESYLRILCEEGAQHRYRERAAHSVIRQRLEYELGVIHTMGFEHYFLIVWDLCRYARERSIWYNARGSAAGSLVAYVLDITLVDPIHHELLFERFLNPGRISMPDIDLDFRDDCRSDMLEYVVKKYGQDKVAQIITFGTMGARAALRDVGRVMDIPLNEVDRIAKLVPNIPGKPTTLVDALKDVPDFRTAYDSAPHIRELVDTASKMEGVVRSAGTHAAGVVISDKPLINYLPLHRPTSGSEETPVKIVTQFEMGVLEKLKMLKVDFLGLATLTIMARACEMIRQRHSVKYHLGNIPTDNLETYQMLGDGNTAGVFQLEGSGMTRWLVQMKPEQLEHVIAMVALFRPGPMDFIPDYISRMHGEQPVEYRHPALAPIFDSTFGIPVYQEQLMRAAVELAGYSPSEADDLRAAISKKKKHEIQRHRKKFIKGAESHGIHAAIAEAIYSDWEEFARYGFNKSHAADYGVIAVQTAYLKRHHPEEFFTALLSVSKNQTEKVALYVENCRSMGIEVLPPDINTSDWDFTIEDHPDQAPAIRFGLGAIKNVGQGGVELITKARSDSPFKNLNDFARRIDLRAVGKRSLESLIKVGALDQFGERPTLLDALDRIVAISTAHFRATQAGQLSLFGTATGVSDSIALTPAAPLDRREILNWERELLGLYISEHPLTPYTPVLSSMVSHFSGQLSEAAQHEKATVAGMVTNIRPYQTKAGNMMGWVTIEDIQGNIELVLFPRTWDKYQFALEIGGIILAEGKVDAQSTPPKILVDKLRTQVETSFTSEGQLLSLAQDESNRPNPSPTSEKLTTGEKSITEVSSSDLSRKSGHKGKTDEPPPPPETFPPDWDNTQALPEPFPPNQNQRIPVLLNEEPAASLETRAAPPEYTKGEQPPTNVASQDTIDRTPVIALPPSRMPITSPGSSEQAHPPQMVTITLRPSGDQSRDTRRIQRLHGLVISYPGYDHFSFLIYESGRGHLIEFPNETTHVCGELIERLRRLIGEENFRIEPIMYQ